MIVPSMNYAEMIEEVRKDIPLVFDISDRKEHKVKRIIQKAALFPVRLPGDQPQQKPVAAHLGGAQTEACGR